MKVADIQVTPIHPERWGNDLDVVNAARVSFHKEADWDRSGEEEFQKNGIPYDLKLRQADVKLINYLAKHKHFSPFNHSFISVRVKAPIFVARQLVKHKFMPWNEVSRRYVDEEPEFYFPKYWRKKADNVKQGSSEEAWEENSRLDTEQIKACSAGMALDLYKEMLFQGIAPEQARMVLPQNMHTEWIWSGTLGAFCDMLVLRLDPHTQYESRIVANKIKGHIADVFPVSLKARLEN
jgi:thymidylate synthase (FAD)